MAGEKNSAKPGIAKTFGIVAVLTVFSKFVGLLRDMVVASCYGTGIVADAYNYAYMFTGNVFVLFGGLGGPFHSSTVTVLGSRKDEPTAGAMMAQVFVYTLIGLTAIAGVAALLAPLLVPVLATNYDCMVRSHSMGADMKLTASVFPELQFAEQALYGRQLLVQLYIMLPLIVLAGLTGISYGVMNVYDKIFWPSLSPAIASTAIIVAVLVFSDPDTRLVTGVPLALGTLVGALGQLFAQLPGTFKTGLQYKFRRSLSPGVLEYGAMLWPAVFSTSIGQLIVYIDSWFALQLGVGAWTAVLNSNRLVQLPLGVLLTAMLVPILPRFTEQANANRIDDLKEELRRSLRFLWFLSLPLAAIFLVLAVPIVRLLFERGNFTEESTALVSLALVYLAPSIFFYVARDLMTRVFYAFKDSKTPYHVALAAIVVKTVLDWYFVTQTNMGVAGLSTASTLITVFNLALLTIFLEKKIGGLGLNKLVRPLIVMLLSSALSGAAAWFCYGFLYRWFLQMFAAVAPAAADVLATLAALMLSCAGAAVLYAGTGVALKLEEPRMLSKRLPLIGKFMPKEKS